MRPKLPRRRPLRILLTLATIALVAAWALLLRPQALGGPAAYVIVSGESMEPRLHTGDLVILLEKSTYDIGDVIAYDIPKGTSDRGAFVIHRIVGGSARAGYVTRGDNRGGRDLWRPTPQDTLGTMRFSIPRIGHVLTFVRSPLGMALVAGLAAFLFVSAGGRPRPSTNGRDLRCPYARAYAASTKKARARRRVRPA